jgi:hypothetical protein
MMASLPSWADSYASFCGLITLVRTSAVEFNGMSYLMLSVSHLSSSCASRLLIKSIFMLAVVSAPYIPLWMITLANTHGCQTRAYMAHRVSGS